MNEEMMKKALDDLKWQIEHYERDCHIDIMSNEEELRTTEEFKNGAEYGRSKTLQLIQTHIFKKYLEG